jgi:hypothetical protein
LGRNEKLGIDALLKKNRFERPFVPLRFYYEFFYIMQTCN